MTCLVKIYSRLCLFLLVFASVVRAQPADYTEVRQISTCLNSPARTEAELLLWNLLRWWAPHEVWAQ